jgi:hypothetical protein
MYRRKDKLKKHMLIHLQNPPNEGGEPAEEKQKGSSKKTTTVFCQYCGKVYAK